MSDDPFDRYLRYDELTAWLHDMVAAHPALMAVDSYGRSSEGRELWLATITDTTAGPASSKPAHWVDANIHSVEVTGGVAALHLIHRLLTGFGIDELVTRAVRTRTFYVAPRVNPDGVEWALADRPRYRRSSTRPWPWSDGHLLPGLHVEDIDDNGRILFMRLADPKGAWTPSHLDPRVLVPVGIAGTPDGVPRYRLLLEGTITDWDGFTLPTPRPPEALDLNRNFPAGWATKVRGSGDHPLSEPEIDALVRAVRAHPNVCGYNAYHTSGGVLLRPSSMHGDDKLQRRDLWTYRLLGDLGTELTGYSHHSVYEDYTFDRRETMSGAADDWAYEHLGVFGWTTEFWDPVKAATGVKQHDLIWYLGPTEAEEVAVLRWADEHDHDMFVEWFAYDHPQLGPVELGGWDEFRSWTNPPLALLAAEVRGHDDFALHQALAAPCIEIVHSAVEPLGDGTWRIVVGLANTGYLPTYVTEHARAESLVLPLVAEISGVGVIGGTARQELGQLGGRLDTRFSDRNDGSPDRCLVAWTVRASGGTEARVTATHPRAGTASISLAIPSEGGAVRS